jgi:hypothetical protein
VSICSPSTSEPKPGVADAVVISSFVLAATIAKKIPWLTDAIAATATLINLHLSDFCAIDPPADPGLSGLDMVAIMTLGNANPDPGPMLRMNQLIQRAIWNDVCQCAAGGPPAITLPASPPSGSPVLNPPSVTNQPVVGNCFAVSKTGIQNVDTLTHYYTDGGDSTTLAYLPLPQGAAYMTVCAQAGTPGAAPYDRLFGFGMRNAAGANVSPSAFVDVGPTGSPAGGPTSGCQTVAVPPTATQFNIQSGVTGTGVHTGTFNAQFSISCGGLAGQPQNPCCPPDPTATGLLASILQMVTLIQRQAAPFAYIPGATHTGLSGTGQLTVSALLGVKVDLTTTPARLGEIAGDPVSIWEAGWINIGTADGFGPRLFISSDPMIVLPVSGAATLIGYSIPDDVVVTITELVREP